MVNRRGSVFVNLIVIGLSILIFIFASPILYDIISEVAGGFGTATAFIIKSFIWVIFLILISISFKVVSSNEGFFV